MWSFSCFLSQIESQDICSKLFSLDNSGLDTSVAALSQELIDDYPASDPRWAESIPSGRKLPYNVVCFSCLQ